MENSQEKIKSFKERQTHDSELCRTFEANFFANLKKGDFVDFKRGAKWVVAQVTQRFQNAVGLSLDGFDIEIGEV